MQLEAFEVLFRDVARAETRICTVPPNDGLAPAGAYFLREFYCIDADCDCRQVFIEFIPVQESTGTPQAIVGYGWEKAKYYKKWSREAANWQTMAEPTLVQSVEQGPAAKGFLKVFKKVVEDHMVVAAYRRHYLLVKALSKGPEPSLPP